MYTFCHHFLARIHVCRPTQWRKHITCLPSFQGSTSLSATYSKSPSNRDVTWVYEHPNIKSRLKTLGMHHMSATEHPHSITVGMPGFRPDEYDNKFGLVRVKYIITRGTLALTYVNNVPYNSEGDTFLDWLKVRNIPGATIFNGSTKVEFYKSLYDPKTPIEHIEATYNLGKVGKSTCAFVADFRNGDERGESLWKQTTQFVRIDEKSMRPSPFPEWFKDKFSGKGIPGCQGFVMRPFKRPEDTYVYDIKVRLSDIDSHNHTHSISYVDFAQSAVYSALTSPRDASKASSHIKALEGFTEKRARNGMKRLEVLYQSESQEGQELKVHVWQSEDDADNVVRCSIEGDGGVVCQLLLEAHD